MVPCWALGGILGPLGASWGPRANFIDFWSIFERFLAIFERFLEDFGGPWQPKSIKIRKSRPTLQAPVNVGAVPEKCHGYLSVDISRRPVTGKSSIFAMPGHITRGCFMPTSLGRCHPYMQSAHVSPASRDLYS